MDLCFEPFNASKHLEGFIAMRTNPRVMALIPKKTQTREEAIDFFESLMEKEKTSNGDFKIMACCVDNEFIGLGANIVEKRGIEIAYSLREEYWGKGLGSKICAHFIEIAKSNNKANLPIFAEVNENNIGSIKILEKFMTFKEKFFNEEDQAFDLIYEF